MKYSDAQWFYIILLMLFSFPLATSAQDDTKQRSNLVYVDKQGVLRYTSGKAEAAFFGVNYTTPFAYAYRAHKALGVDIEKAIRQDVYHFARLGFDAFRVHVWDTEIADSAGNLLENEHLRLFDFLLAELKKRNIKTIITPIAFWGNGYPEKDEQTPGFSRIFGRGKLTTNDTAIRAQENYMRQFFKHVNPYTRLSYEADKDIIAVEINNEPSHSGPKAGVTNYINRLGAAVKSTGWSKPVFYNISQAPYYSDAVAGSLADGFSFQWYPTGLVSGHTLKGNFLPHVDEYLIPFRDTVPAFAKKALMVYEFDAADIFQSYMYPAMAKSFRAAGFQWATQFAYDPMALAYANTEYQTHYLNLAYTPSKAISMLIAGEVFHQVPRLKKYGAAASDGVFDVFRVSYKEALSEMNTGEKFYYSNSTSSRPLVINLLKSVAGVGNSPVVTYPGTGAYFLDKLEEGVWRLEVMPDAVSVRDPFERASPKKVVTAIRWRVHPIKVKLPNLGTGFSIKGLNDGNTFSGVATGDSFTISPGTYLMTRTGKSFTGLKQANTVIGLNEFVAPPASKEVVVLKHEPQAAITAGRPFTISALIDASDSAKVTVQVSRLGGGRSRNVRMAKNSVFGYAVDIPAEQVVAGQLHYRIIVEQGKDFSVYPGNLKGDPFAWDNYYFETWKTNVAAGQADLELYNPSVDQEIFTHPSFRPNFETGYTTGIEAGSLLLRLSATGMQDKDVMGFQHYVGNKLSARATELNSFDTVVIRAVSELPAAIQAKIVFINRDGTAFSSIIHLDDKPGELSIPFNAFNGDSSLLLPGAYPGFQRTWFKSSIGKPVFHLDEIEKMQLLVVPAKTSSNNSIYGVEIGSVQLRKRK